MKDVQNNKDFRGITIQQVGLQDVNLPFIIKMKTGDPQPVLANIKITVDLNKHYKGTHMSRFMEILTKWGKKPMASPQIRDILTELTHKLETGNGHMYMDFKYFLERPAPVSDQVGLLDYNCSFSGELVDDEFEFIMGVEVPFTSLCPCSKELSRYGAHNQRSCLKIKIKCREHKFLWLEELITLAESVVSSPVYPLLKREDEKYVTEHAYENPKFVEDTIRDLVLTLREQPNIIWFDAECINFESIHNHNAYARHSEWLHTTK